MSETPIAIANLNDFIFCPVSIYFHRVDMDSEDLMMKGAAQLNGSAAHEKSDSAAYSTKRSMLQGISVYCEKYNLSGKIDTFDYEKGILTERKKKIKTVYDGYVFQLYAQYFSLLEMGYHVNEIRLYSMSDNKVYPVKLPENNMEMYQKFEKLINEINSFSFDGFIQTNRTKCENCIYRPLCSYSA